MNDLLKSIHVEQFLNSNEVDHLDQMIASCSRLNADIGDIYGDRYFNQQIADVYSWDYASDTAAGIRELLNPKFFKIFNQQPQFRISQILDSKIPYVVHTDYGINPEYTFIIPLADYNANTVIFNESFVGSNKIDDFKKTYTGEVKLKMDPKFCADHLSHIHPKDLLYLTLKELFPWRKGSFFAFDRRLFHCSDNFLKRNIPCKRGIIMWAYF